MKKAKKVPSKRFRTSHLPDVGNNYRLAADAATWFARFGLMGCLGLLLSIPGCMNDQVLASTKCGNGVFEPDAGEECDDGDDNGPRNPCGLDCRWTAHEVNCDDLIDEDGDGLIDCDDPDCQGEDWCNPVCGNNNLENGEQCDDGNTVDGDGCSASCELENCGDGNLDPGEECDDGNNVGGDGCSSTCTIEPTCGNGIAEAGEVCDDGNTEDCDFCNNTCSISRQEDCIDRIDNDGDGDTDCADTECASCAGC